jgi:hypothetical protein
MDREKVIKAWECCNPFNRKCNECPYEKDCYHDGISRHMVADAIALLKEQEEKRAKAYEILLDLSNVTKDIDDTLLSAMDYLMPDEEANK